MMTASEISEDPSQIVDAIIQKTGKHIKLALPLGLGKANHIANALVQRACEDPELQLDIITALTLDIPQPVDELSRRFLQPATERLFGDYPRLTYCELLRAGGLPKNIRVSEFFLLAGQWVGSPAVQQAFIPANYTHALDYLLHRGVNVVAQLLSQDGDRFSLGSNPDISADLLHMRRNKEVSFLFVGQVNSELPFMNGSAEIPAGDIDLLLAGEKTDFPLYSAPKRPVSLEDQAIGLHVSSLIRDGGTLQIGIGSIGDAVSHALILRHEKNREYRDLLQELSKDTADESSDKYAVEPFQEGLYGLSEMFVDGFLHLSDHGILKRCVDGAILHAGFFVDCREFYRRLSAMSVEQRARFQMKPVSFTNELYSGHWGSEAEKRAARQKASFINNGMMATLSGAVVSDALENGNVISGVGGQYNFVAQAFALHDADSILTINATRQSGNKTLSNIVLRYGHQTIPWHLRDIIVTEYGIARLKGTTESEATKAMLRIADSRFQQDLLKQAQRAGKLPGDWELESRYRDNSPARIRAALHQSRLHGLLPVFPYGTDFTAEEQRLLESLTCLKNMASTRLGLAQLYAAGLVGARPSDLEQRCLERMGLAAPGSLSEHVYRTVLRAALVKTRT